MELRKEIDQLAEFIKKNTFSLITMCIVVAVSYWHFLATPNYRIDSIIKLIYEGSEFNDLELGRFGIVLINRLLGMVNGDPYSIGFFALLTMMVAVTFMAYCLYRASNNKFALLAIVVSTIIYITPNWAEQLYFSYQAFIIMIGVLFVELAVYLVYNREMLKTKVRWALAFVLLFIAASIYQANGPMFITLTIAMLMVDYISREDKDSINLEKDAIGYIIILCLAMALYFVFSKIFAMHAPETDYLTRQVMWEMVDLDGIIFNLSRAFMSIVCAEAPTDTFSFTFSVLTVFATFIFYTVKNKKYKFDALLGAMLLILQFSAFAMIIAIGTRTAIRSELSVTIVYAINFFLSVLFFYYAVREGEMVTRRVKAFGFVVGMMFFIAFFLDAKIFFGLIYTDDIRYERDYTIASELKHLLSQNTSVNETNKPVVMIGEPDMSLNSACVDGEAIGVSFFKYHEDMYTTNIIATDFLRSQGINYRIVNDEQVLAAEELAIGMPDFPNKDSVKETDGFIVVKFSDNPYKDIRFLTPGYKVSEDVIKTFSEDYMCGIDKVVLDGENNLILKGFALQRGVDPKSTKSVVLMRDMEDDTIYELSTGGDQRIMLAKKFAGDGVNYESCGLIVKTPIDFIENNPAHDFEIIIKNTLSDGQVNYVRTSFLINERIIKRER